MNGENQISIGGMRIELFLSSEQMKKEIIIAHLSHGSNIVTIVTGDEPVEDCDALITRNRRFSLGIKTADCAPICFSDGNKIGIAHVGWRGLCLGLIEKMLTNFDATNLSLYVAPFLHSFEIQKDFCYEQITQKFEKRFISEQEGKLLFNFKEAIASLMPPQVVYDVRNTATDFSLPSYRREKTSERLVTTVSFYP
jgi:polyphenol oxidase